MNIEILINNCNQFLSNSEIKDYEDLLHFGPTIATLNRAKKNNSDSKALSFLSKMQEDEKEQMFQSLADALVEDLYQLKEMLFEEEHEEALVVYWRSQTCYFLFLDIKESEKQNGDSITKIEKLFDAFYHIPKPFVIRYEFESWIETFNITEDQWLDALKYPSHSPVVDEGMKILLAAGPKYK